MKKNDVCAEVTFAALTNEASGEGLVTPGSGKGSWSISGMYGESGRLRALQMLAEGGYAIDLRPLAEHPDIAHWVLRSPMPDGRIEGIDIDRLPDEVRRAAADMAPFMGGDFQSLAFMMSARAGEPPSNTREAGPFDYVSAAYRAAWWGAKGARIGRRVGDTIVWSDGSVQEIERGEEECRTLSPSDTTTSPHMVSNS